MRNWRSIVLVAASSLVIQVCVSHAQSPQKADPVLSNTGPDADKYGRQLGYPIGWPFDRLQTMVGDYSHFDQLPGVRTRTIAGAARPSILLRAQTELSLSYTFHDAFSFGSSVETLANYLAREPATGFLIVRDQTILFEHYQYGRTDHDRFSSQSMAKTITAMLIGIAISEGAIHSVDDTAETYVPELNGTEIGKTPIRALLHMASGIDFGQDEGEYIESDANTLDHLLIGKEKVSTIEAVLRFNKRIAAPDTRWHYSNLDTEILGLVLVHATHMTLSDYLQTRIWQPMGAESSAIWRIDTSGQEVAYTNFNATLRDYARFGLVLAHDGFWNGRQIIPRQWLLDATQPVEQGSFLALDNTAQPRGYGYLTWLLPGPQRMFFADGHSGQRIFADPKSQLVLVQTAVEAGASTPEYEELIDLWNAAVKQVSAN